MPKLNPYQILGRIEKRIEQLENDEKLEPRDIKALLNDEQRQTLKDAWAEQKDLRKTHKTKEVAQRDNLVWKTIREVRLDVYRQAQTEAIDGFFAFVERRKIDQDLRAIKIYYDAIKVAEDNKKDEQTAKNEANNALTRAGLPRFDQTVVRRGLSKRDDEVWAMEDELRARIKAQMTPDELEQLAMSEAYDASVNRGFKV